MKKILLVAGMFASLNANANLIVNGGFEDYSVPPGQATHVYSTAGTCSLSAIFGGCTLNQPSYGWNPTNQLLAPNEFLEIRHTDLIGPSQEGSNFAELNPSETSGIMQTFIAQAGTGTLSWWDKGREGVNYGYGVYVNGMSITGLETQSSDNWLERSFVFNLLDGENTLQFVSSLGTTHLGAQIDNVSMLQTTVSETTAVPEPETYGMMMLGLAMLGFASRRRKA